MASAPATVGLLHRFLGIGLLMLASVFLLLRYLGVAPMLPHDRSVSLIGQTFAGIGLVAIAMAVYVLKPRVPSPQPGQTAEQYVATPAVAAAIMPVWFCLEGAGVLTLVGYVMTDETAAALVAGLAIFKFWTSGPSAFARTVG